jgi:hypothetical protein
MADVRQGGCQCGAVRYQVTGQPIAVSVCHCRECQRQSGSAFGMSMIVPREAFRLLAGEMKSFTRNSDSGRPVTCSFCGECGTRIHHEVRYMAGVLNIKPGTLDDTSFLAPSTEVWSMRRYPWVQLATIERSFEGQPAARS